MEINNTQFVEQKEKCANLAQSIVIANDDLAKIERKISLLQTQKLIEDCKLALIEAEICESNPQYHPMHNLIKANILVNKPGERYWL